MEKGTPHKLITEDIVRIASYFTASYGHFNESNQKYDSAEECKLAHPDAMLYIVWNEHGGCADLSTVVAV